MRGARGVRRVCSVALGSLARIWLEFNSIQIQVGPPGRAPPAGVVWGRPHPTPPPPPLALLARTRATSRGKAGAKRGARACGKVNFDPHCFAGNANLEIPPSQKYINVFVGSHREPSCFAARKQRSGRVSAPPSWQGRGLVGTSLWSTRPPPPRYCGESDSDADSGVGILTLFQYATICGHCVLCCSVSHCIVLRCAVVYNAMLCCSGLDCAAVLELCLLYWEMDS